MMETSKKLVPALPHKSLLHKSIVLSILGHTVICVAFKLAAYFLMQEEDYFEAVHKSSKLAKSGYETTVVFISSLPQYLFVGFIFGMFTPFRVPIYKNILFMIGFILGLAGAYWVILYPLDFMKDSLEVKELDQDFKWSIAAITLLNGLV